MTIHENGSVVSAGKALTYRTFDTLVSNVSESITDGRAPVAVDCRHLEFVDPFGMVGLTLLARSYRHKSHENLTFFLPAGNVRSYLGRAGFLRAASPFANFVPALDEDWLELMDGFHGGIPSLLEVTALEQIGAIAPVLDCVHVALCSHLSYPKNDAFDICIMLSEVCHNVFEHSGERAVGYVAMQPYTNRHEQRFLQIAVGDNGLGIPKTLRRNPQYVEIRTDIDAILRSFDYGVSEFDEATRGNGLYHLASLVVKHEGTLTVRSGMGKVYIRGDKRKGTIFRVSDLEGTQFAITF